MITGQVNHPSLPERVLIVCTGNICRSPTVEAVLRTALEKARMEIEVDSAGTEDYHRNQPPDSRSIRHAQKRGYDLSSLRARQICDADFDFFDLILVADTGHLAELRRRCPARLHAKIALFLGTGSLPDPYYGDADGFELVLDLVEQRVKSLICAWEGS